MKVVILAGETSGDNYGALLIEKIKKLSKDTFIAGTGGNRMRQQVDLFIEGIPYGKMGFSGILKNLRVFYRSFRRIKNEIEKLKPDRIVFIDNPGFNLKMAQALGKKFPCYYYIPPKIWAHQYSRIKIIKKYICAVIPIFGFEEEIYRKEGVVCRWFGHPAVDLLLQAQTTRIEEPPASRQVQVIGILPGSRQEEVSRLLPVFIRITQLLKHRIQCKVKLSSADPDIKSLEELILNKYREKFDIIEGPPYKVINNSDILLATSGTVNLEVALTGKPLLVFYKTSILNYLLARIVVKLKMVSPVNLLYGEKIVPEYIQRFPYDRIVNDCLDILNKGELYRRQMDRFRTITGMTGNGSVSEKTAGFILGLE